MESETTRPPVWALLTVLLLLGSVAYAWYQANSVLAAVAGLVGTVLGAVAAIGDLFGKKVFVGVIPNAVAVVGAAVAVGTFVAFIVTSSA